VQLGLLRRTLKNHAIRCFDRFGDTGLRIPVAFACNFFRTSRVTSIARALAISPSRGALPCIRDNVKTHFSDRRDVILILRALASMSVANPTSNCIRSQFLLGQAAEVSRKKPCLDPTHRKFTDQNGRGADIPEESEIISSIHDSAKNFQDIGSDVRIPEPGEVNFPPREISARNRKNPPSPRGGVKSLQARDQNPVGISPTMLPCREPPASRQMVDLILGGA